MASPYDEENWNIDPAASGHRYRLFLDSGPYTVIPAELIAYFDGRWEVRLHSEVAYMPHGNGKEASGKSQEENLSNAQKRAILVYEALTNPL